MVQLEQFVMLVVLILVIGPNGGGFLDLAGNKTCRTGPGSGGDRGDTTAGRHVGDGTRDYEDHLLRVLVTLSAE